MIADVKMYNPILCACYELCYGFPEAEEWIYGTKEFIFLFNIN